MAAREEAVLAGRPAPPGQHGILSLQSLAQSGEVLSRPGRVTGDPEGASGHGKHGTRTGQMPPLPYPSPLPGPSSLTLDFLDLYQLNN